MTFTDEQLSAYLDGELSENESLALEKAMETDPELAQRLDRLAKIDQALSDTYDPILQEPIPDSIMDMLSDNSAKDTSPNIVNFADEKEKRKSWLFPSAIAASLIAGFMAANLLQSTTPNPDGLLITGPVNKNNPLYAALSAQPSGNEVNTIKPILSFKSTNGEYCREFTASESRGLACLQSGGWVVLSQIYEAPNGSETGYATASAQSQAGFDLLIDRLMEGEVLSSEEETNLISAGWSD